MHKISNFKKGVSPLIATVLLIAFAVALGSVVMNWGLNLNFGKTADNCRNVEIKIRNMDGSDACFGGSGQNGYVNFIIDNTGLAEVNGLRVIIDGEKGTKLFDLDKLSIKKGSLYDKKDQEVSYDFSQYGDIKQISFIPKIITGQTEICTKNSIEAKAIGKCS